MSTKISDYANVEQRIEELGCIYPNGFAVLPVNFESAASIADFRSVAEAATVKTLLRSAGLPLDDIVERAARPPYISNHSYDWVAPTLFVSLALLSQNPHFVAVALSTIANYLTDFFRGGASKKTIKMNIVVERAVSRSCKKVTYEGPPEGLKEIAEIVRSASDE